MSNIKQSITMIPKFQKVSRRNELNKEWMYMTKTGSNIFIAVTVLQWMLSIVWESNSYWTLSKCISFSKQVATKITTACLLLSGSQNETKTNEVNLHEKNNEYKIWLKSSIYFQSYEIDWWTAKPYFVYNTFSSGKDSAILYFITHLKHRISNIKIIKHGQKVKNTYLSRTVIIESRACMTRPH